MRGACLDEPEHRRVPEQGAAAVAEQHLVAVGQREELGEAATRTAPTRLRPAPAGGWCRAGRRRPRPPPCAGLGAHLRRPGPEAAVAGEEVAGDHDPGRGRSAAPVERTGPPSRDRGRYPAVLRCGGRWRRARPAGGPRCASGSASPRGGGSRPRRGCGCAGRRGRAAAPGCRRTRRRRARRTGWSRRRPCTRVGAEAGGQRPLGGVERPARRVACHAGDARRAASNVARRDPTGRAPRGGRASSARSPRSGSWPRRERGR